MRSGAGVRGLQRGGGIDQSAAGGIDEQNTRPAAGQGGAIDHVPGRLVERNVMSQSARAASKTARPSGSTSTKQIFLLCRDASVIRMENFRMSDPNQPGFFISFEGSEGCGKSTQIGLLMQALGAAGLEVVLVREPGGTAIGETIRHLLQHADEGRAMAAETELLLFAASRAQLVRETILPALAAGRVVVSDRFLDSTTVYQGIARKIAAGQVAAINEFAAGARRPDVTFLLDMDSAEAMRRLAERTATRPDRMEEEPPEFYEAVRQGYLALATREPDRVRVLDAGQPPAIIAGHIVLELRRHAFLQRSRF
jgi:dTMP kinase